ncbi:putative DNA-binding protein RAV1 [Heracleum sosnowskyi]|uniref:DNA-binding protein RAV1 n=1 Tax=Heracleum sosnowskyi TaxID=360622 RepID=A0AAD8HJY5_9APIA|nr:putative DNA-binding protein RAV1 [Heracleum sosnowskyi]
MASPCHLKLKPLHSFHVFSLKSPSSFSTNATTSSTKFKTLAQTFILSHICRIVRALTKAKIILIGVLKDIQLLHLTEFTTKKNKNKKKIFCGSFRMHYNWCSSHVLPVASPQENKLPVSHSYYDATWNSIISPGCDEMEESQLSGYLHWLEKKVNEGSNKTNDMNEIDKLADMFIANCHEKFKLEKQESYRMFQEMMARSV